MMDFDDPENASGKKSDKQPMYASTPEDNAPVAKNTFLLTVGLLCTIAFGLLVVVIMCLNGTISPVNDAQYVRPALVDNMDDYDVVKHVMRQCRHDLAMNITKLQLSPDPLVLPNRAFNTTFDMHLHADMPEEVNLQLVVQHLEPPWKRLPCVNGRGSCIYDNACEHVGKIFGKKSCKELTRGHHSGTVPERMVDMLGPLGFIRPGNYFIHVRINFRDETFGCIVMSFRVRSDA